MTFIVYQIGCLECGCPSGLRGMFNTEAEARELAKRLDDKHYWAGIRDYMFDVVELPTACGEIAWEREEH